MALCPEAPAVVIHTNDGDAFAIVVIAPSAASAMRAEYGRSRSQGEGSGKQSVVHQVGAEPRGVAPVGVDVHDVDSTCRVWLDDEGTTRQLGGQHVIVRGGRAG